MLAFWWLRVFETMFNICLCWRKWVWNTHLRKPMKSEEASETHRTFICKRTMLRKLIINKSWSLFCIRAADGTASILKQEYAWKVVGKYIWCWRLVWLQHKLQLLKWVIKRRKMSWIKRAGAGSTNHDIPKTSLETSNGKLWNYTEQIGQAGVVTKRELFELSWTLKTAI
jgi:hypothetical protein